MTPRERRADGGDDGSEAFALLGSETRLGVLQALWADPSTPLAFSELREAVGMRDSGQFNYHLNKLVGQFIERTDDGYRLKTAGVWVMGALQAGMYQTDAVTDAIPMAESCRSCGGSLVAHYADERMTIACEACGETIGSGGILPGALSAYDPVEYPAVFDRWLRMLVERVRWGFCITCAGRMTTTLELDADRPDDSTGPAVVHRCERCPERVIESVGESLLSSPAVVAFYHDHGRDVRDEPTWAQPWTEEAVVESTDPIRVRVDVPIDGETLSLVVDGDARVVGETRR